MAITSWDQVKRNIPGVGDRAYIIAGYIALWNGQLCT